MNNSDLTSRSVGTIVKDNFAASRVFKYFGIDFCCGGTATLAEACRLASVDVEHVVAALNEDVAQGGGAIPFDTWPTDLLIDYVLKIHHRNIRTYGPELLTLIEKVAARHGKQHPELNDLVKLFASSLEDLESHLQKEEKVLFPYAYDLFYAAERGEHTTAMHCGTVANPIRVMHSEHNDEGTRYKFIRNLMSGFAVPEDACASYRLMLHDLEVFMDGLFEHIHIENNILFPRFIELEAKCVVG